eukprot:snap_masked-scaffold127_size327531-processed-gene-1.2 protein:Tk07871 transcript:snap_masked-scaffold127_size327531-processed-gene-1.2-mRNA-1 annotation:"hypothetical protein DAPPUDRAFT_312162"
MPSSSAQQPLFSPGTPNNIKSGFNHLNDIFSEFTKHIAPSYHHERPERSIQMRLYTMHKGQHLLIFIMFLCLFLIALLMGMAGPRIITEHTETATKLKTHNNLTNLPQGPFIIVTPQLSPYRQQLWISAALITKEKGQEAFAKKCNVFIQVEGMRGKDNKVLVGGRGHNRSRTIKCDDKQCESFIVMHLGVLEFSHYLVNISLTGLESIHRHFSIQDILFTIVTFNPEFTELEIWFRFFFVLATIVITILFLISMKNFPLEDWSIEQKWIGLLLPLLLGFDDPLFPWTLTTSSLIPTTLDVILQATFIFGLLLFWLCIFHGLRQTERGLYRFYLPKFFLVGCMWFASVTLAVLEETNQLRDPSFSYQLNTAHYRNFQMYFTGMLALYLVYLIYLALRAFGELRSMNFLDARLKFHACSMIVVLCLTLSIVISRYGRGVLEDNFVARIYTSYDSGGQFLAFYTVINCYLYVLAYVYTPTSAQTRENHLLKDNPAFSMINESDDETEAMLVHTDDSPPTQPKFGGRNPNSGSRRPLILGHDDDSD